MQHFNKNMSGVLETKLWNIAQRKFFFRYIFLVGPTGKNIRRYDTFHVDGRASPIGHGRKMASHDNTSRVTIMSSSGPLVMFETTIISFIFFLYSDNPN